MPRCRADWRRSSLLNTGERALARDAETAHDNSRLFRMSLQRHGERVAGAVCSGSARSMGEANAEVYSRQRRGRRAMVNAVILSACVARLPGL